MKIAAHRGSRLHAPENSKAALLSAWIAGADVLEFDLQLTKDDRLILSHDGTTERLTGKSGRILDLTLDELKALDWSATFRPPDSPNFIYYPPGTDGARKLSVLTFEEALQFLPEEAGLLIELKHDSADTPSHRETLVQKAIALVMAHRLESRTVVYSKDVETIKLARQTFPALRYAVFDFDLSPADQLALLKSSGADGLVTDLDSVLSEGALTEFGAALAEYCRDQRLAIGAILYPFRTPGIFTDAEFHALRKHSFVWSVSTDSVLRVQPLIRHSIIQLAESFKGAKLKRSKFAFGYAKANPYGEVTQNDGVVIKIDPFPKDQLPGPPVDDLDRRLKSIEIKALFTAKDWPYYSGGGVGVLQGILGDFSAEVDYLVDSVDQATTLEMAVVNVDPGAHVEGRPKSFRDKDSFYDPHGAPPFVGVEHDENDGFRINWNLGSEYDNNQYGRPVGDGNSARSGRLRLDRRGSYWAAYYRRAKNAAGEEIGPDEWVCVGVTRNDAMNATVFLRCVGKRWRQERVLNPDPFNPDHFHPILANTYTFKNLTITRHLLP
jgi:glycerophosphoryl diester phosphodiesterase